MIFDRINYRPRKTDLNRMLNAFLLRTHRTRKRGRGLVNRLRKVMYPRARKAGPVYPSIRPSRPEFPKIISW